MKSLLFFCLTFLNTFNANNVTANKEQYTSKLAVSAEVTGNLYHVTYWNENDNWDLRYLDIVLTFEDKSSETIKFDNERVHYSFDNPIPKDGITSFTIQDAYFVNFDNSTIPLTGKLKFSVAIQKYPYSNTTTTLSSLGWFGIVICLSFIWAVLLHKSIQFKKTVFGTK